jgi:hypothetical protein
LAIRCTRAATTRTTSLVVVDGARYRKAAAIDFNDWLALHCSLALTDRLWSSCGCNASWRDKIARFVRLNGARTRADGIKPWPAEDIDPIEELEAQECDEDEGRKGAGDLPN